MVSLGEGEGERRERRGEEEGEEGEEEGEEGRGGGRGGKGRGEGSGSVVNKDSAVTYKCACFNFPGVYNLWI